MNYLAHIFLSGTDAQLQLGNFIGDAVKGSAYLNYPPSIADGIRLHRAIDTFTDRHPVIREAVQSLRPYFGRYSAVLLDIYFDYLLASHFDQFSPLSLKRFTRRFYGTMIRKRRYLPDRIRRFMWHFIGTDRLARYATQKGIRESLEIMTGIGRIKIDPKTAMEYLSGHDSELWAVFEPFFGELQAFCEGYIQAADRAGYVKERQ